MKEQFEKYLFDLYRQTKFKFVRKMILSYLCRFGDATMYLMIDPKNEKRIDSALGLSDSSLLDDNCQVLNDIDEEVLLTRYRKLDDKGKKMAVEIIKLLYNALL